MTLPKVFLLLLFSNPEFLGGMLFVEIHFLDLLDLGEDQVDNAFPCNRWTRPQTPWSRVTADVT